MSTKIQADVASGHFAIRVQDNSIVVTSVELRDAGPVVIVQPVNWRLYTGLGVGLGVGLLLVIILAVTLGAALYGYRRYCTNFVVSVIFYHHHPQALRKAECPLRQIATDPSTLHVHTRRGDGRGRGL